LRPPIISLSIGVARASMLLETGTQPPIDGQWTPMSNAYAPVRGKCTFWRESTDPEDEYDPRLRAAEKRVNCSCFVEGYGWRLATEALPEDCPYSRRCRYYIRCW